MLKKLVSILLLNIVALFAVASETESYDLSKDKVLYAIGYSHLDTQWRWDYKKSIEKYIKKTLDGNFKLFEKYPEYVFNFTGSVRYQMMKEYYPEKYEKLKEYIASGRWFVSGSSVDECDVLVPSSESIVRPILYGNDYFRKEFGKESIDFMLPDCFGFPACLPTLWAHCGLKGFSTQKLTWGSAIGMPFDIGIWEGVDGQGVIAALNPGKYVGSVKKRLDLDEKWVDAVNKTGEKYGVYVGYHYYGVGDRGGAPRKKDVEKCIESLNNPDGQIKVVLTSTDQMYKDITDEQKSKLPRHKGDMLLIEHSTATLTSQAYMKRWNRKNEQLANSAERAAVAASFLGGADYPLEKINRSWVRVLASQMHDILPGTSIPKAYEYSWNDEVIALNGFAAVLENSVGAISRAMDTRVEGQAIVVYNPLEIVREDILEAKVDFPKGCPEFIGVYDYKGQLIPSQVLSKDEKSATIIFAAKLPSVGYGVYDVAAVSKQAEFKTTLKINSNTIENDNYKVTVNPAGDVSSVFDKKANKELLASPARLEFLREVPIKYPAWNMYWKDRRKPVAGYVEGPAKIKIVENGPVRVALEIARECADSVFIQKLCLSAGDAGSRVEFKTYIDWQTKECCLKAAFPLTVSNPNATYNLTMGTIQRNTNHSKKFEVPSHEWFDLTDKDGSYGVTVLEDCKFGSDKPADNIVRLTLLHTPVARSYSDQGTQDWGRHEFVYGLFGHRDSCQQANSQWQGRRLNQPLVAFQVPPHKGKLGKVFSMLSINTDHVGLQAVKKAENNDYTIIRLQELMGCDAQNVEIGFASKIADAYEVDGQERKIGNAVVKDGKLLVNMTKFSPRSFAVKLKKAPVKLDRPKCKAVALDYNTDVISFNADKKDGKFGDAGMTIPAELLPSEIVSEGIVFEMAPKADGQNNAIACKGQSIKLPSGKYNKLYLLASAEKDTSATFVVGDVKTTLSVQNWTGFIGQFDNRIWKGNYEEVIGFDKGYIKRDNLAWFSTHRHNPNGKDDAYDFSYIFKYALDISKGAKTITLPDNDKIKIFAITVSDNANDDIHPAQSLYDDFSDRDDLTLRAFTGCEYLKGVKPIAEVAIDRKPDFKSFKMGPPVTDDYADKNSGNGVTVDYPKDIGFSKPRSRSWFKDDIISRVIDGQLARNNDDVEKNLWFSGQARFVIDLKKSIDISRINVYSWHHSTRAPQQYTLWGANEKNPGYELEAASKGGKWTFITEVNTTKLGQGQMHGSSITPSKGKKLQYRYLMWDMLEAGSGTFLTEIDVHQVK